MLRHALFLTLVALGPLPEARADVFDGLDVSVASGVATGTVAQEKSDGSVKTFQMGGIPFAAMLNRDLAESWSGSLQAQVMLDLANYAMIRQGFAGTLLYHVLGGARRISHAGDMVTTTSTSRYNLSLAVRGGIFDYAAASRKNPSESVSGGVWEMASGLEYRRDVSETSAFGVSFMTTVVTLPTSVQRLASRTTELLGFWRVYL